MDLRSEPLHGHDRAAAADDGQEPVLEGVRRRRLLRHGDAVPRIEIKFWHLGYDPTFTQRFAFGYYEAGHMIYIRPSAHKSAEDRRREVPTAMRTRRARDDDAATVGNQDREIRTRS